jgi:NADH-quinone oxidoreductase subunit C
MHLIAQMIQEQYPDAFVSAGEFRGELTVKVRREAVGEICRHLRDHPELQFDHLSDVSSVDWPDRDVRFEVVYQLYSIPRHHRLRVKSDVPEDDCEIDSVYPVWRAAGFLEREVYDLMGIRFKGHPDLRRIFLPEDFDGHPLRKEYPAEGKGWRNTFEFLEGGRS